MAAMLCFRNHCRMGYIYLLLLLTIECSTSFSSTALNRPRLIHQIQDNSSQSKTVLPSTTCDALSSFQPATALPRRKFIQKILIATSTIPQPSQAYTPDPDPLRESLYLISRVQEATVQQERFVSRATAQDALKSKMKLTLRLVEKNYRLLDQITYCSEFVPQDNVVAATTAGYEAAEALQNAIDYVRDDLKSGGFEKGQKEYLVENLSECRERLFDFLAFMPRTQLEEARKRVEEENVLNRDEFDGDADAGVYNPVVLPWKNRGEKT